MSELIELDEEIINNEEIDMGSLYHSSTQTNLANQLFNDERFLVLIELSLDTSQIDLAQFYLKNKNELKPDLCIYNKQPKPKSTKQKRLNADILRVPKMPVLAIEVLSPSESVNELLMKFDAYFALGVKSCWLVMPSLEEIKVYSQQGSNKTFDMQRDTEVIDEVLDIRLPIQKIFDRFEL